jgi:uncharacterized spore protein YtfJ
MASADDVKAEVIRETETSDFVPRLAERVGLSARAAAVFGEPVERDGVTVIPVAKAAWGFGGGGGSQAPTRASRGGGEESPSQGSGGGGGGVVTPLGFIEVREAGARFVPRRDPRLTKLLLAASAGLAGLLIGRRT